MNVRIFQLHRRSAYVFDRILDKYNFDISKGVVAIAAGSSPTEVWAKLLVDSFVAYPTFDPHALVSLFTKMGTKQEPQNPTPFMGVQLTGGLLEYICSGSVCGFSVHKQEVTSFPYDITELEKDSSRLDLSLARRQAATSQAFKSGRITLGWNEKALLCTPALARLLIRDKEIAQKLLTLNSFDKFKDCIIALWDQKKLAEEDITLCIIEPYISKEVHTYLPPAGFSFAKASPTSETPEPTPAPALNTITIAKEVLTALQAQLVAQEDTITQLKKQKNRIRNGAFYLLALLVPLVGYQLFKPRSEAVVTPKPAPLPIAVPQQDSLERYTLALYAQDSLLQEGNLATLFGELKTDVLRPEASLDLRISREDSLIGTLHLVGITQADTTALFLPTLKVKHIDNPSAIEKKRLKTLLLTKNKSVKKLKIHIEETAVIFTFPDKSQKSIPLVELLEER